MYSIFGQFWSILWYSSDSSRHFWPLTVFTWRFLAFLNDPGALFCEKWSILAKNWPLGVDSGPSGSLQMAIFGHFLAKNRQKMKILKKVHHFAQKISKVPTISDILTLVTFPYTPIRLSGHKFTKHSFRFLTPFWTVFWTYFGYFWPKMGSKMENCVS